MTSEPGIPRWTRLAAGGGVALVAFTLFVRSVAGGFVYDDIAQVLLNPWISDPAALGQVFTSNAWGYSGIANNYYRPVMHLTYMAAYAVAGFQAPVFHVGSLLLHAANAWLVLLVSERLLRGAGQPPRRALLLATFSALLFAVHPAHVEAVSWIGGVPDLTATAFCLGSFLLYAAVPPERSAFRSLSYAGSLALFALATLSKEIALVFPGVLAAYEVSVGAAAPLGKRASRVLPFAVVAGLYLVARTAALGQFQPVHRFADLSAPQLALSAASLLARYVETLAVPLHLSVFHAFTPVSRLEETLAVAGMASAVALAVLGIALWRKSRALLTGWAMLLFPLLPALYIPAVGESPFAERYLYFPSIGFAVVVAWSVGQAWRAARPAVQKLVVVVSTLVVLVYAGLAFAAQGAWHDDVSLWTNAAAEAPGNPTPHYNLGAALFSAGRFEEAIPEFQAAQRIQPSGMALTGMGLALLGAGHPDQALPFLQQAVSLQPDDPDTYKNLGIAYEALGDRAAAMASFQTALRLAPSSVEVAQHLRRLVAEEARPAR